MTGWEEAPVENAELEKLNRMCAYGHMVLVLAIVICTALIALCAIGILVYATADGADLLGRDRREILITLGHSLIEFVAFVAIIYLLDRMIKDIRDGGTPFTEDSARALKLMATVSIACAAAVVAEQAVGILLLEPSGYNVNVPLIPVGGALILYALALIFGYGAKLQKESDETL